MSNQAGAREFAAKVTTAAREALMSTHSQAEYRRAVWAAMQTIRTRYPIRYAMKRQITKAVLDRVWNEPDDERLEPEQQAFMDSLRGEY